MPSRPWYNVSPGGGGCTGRLLRQNQAVLAVALDDKSGEIFTDHSRLRVIQLEHVFRSPYLHVLQTGE